MLLPKIECDGVLRTTDRVGNVPVFERFAFRVGSRSAAALSSLRANISEQYQKLLQAFLRLLVNAFHGCRVGSTNHPCRCNSSSAWR